MRLEDATTEQLETILTARRTAEQFPPGTDWPREVQAPLEVSFTTVAGIVAGLGFPAGSRARSRAQLEPAWYVTGTFRVQRDGRVELVAVDGRRLEERE